ncbi:MAG: tetratricopeptide repeat protein [Anaerolineae bacterium]|nr:tetratricopeptide repeat protein [Anaerolineae bacterium]
MLPENTAARPLIAVAPLLGNRQTDEAHWIGALFGRLFASHLDYTGLLTLPYNTLAQTMQEQKILLPLSTSAVASLKAALKCDALVYGTYSYDEDSKMLGLRLTIDAPGVPPAPLEATAPASGLNRFVERVSLALIEQLGTPIDDELRRELASIPRPGHFEAFRQLARAHGAWADGQNELALAAVASALALDPEYEEITALEVAIAREAEDTETTRSAFRRWADLARRRNRLSVAAERLQMLGHWLLERGEWPEARRTYEEARDLFRREKDEHGEIQAADNLANIELLMGDMQGAIRIYRRNLRSFENDEERAYDLGLTYFNLSVAHKNLGQYEEAQRALEQAFTLARQVRDRWLYARALAQRGAIYDDTGDWQKAATDYEQAERLFSVSGDELGKAMIRCHRALLLKTQGLYAQSEPMMLEALEQIERIKPEVLHEKAIVWLNLADLYFAMGLYDQSWDYASRAHTVLARLKSGWEPDARKLMRALESLPVPEEEEAEEPASDGRAAEADDLSAPLAGSSIGEPEEGQSTGMPSVQPDRPFPPIQPVAPREAVTGADRPPIADDDPRASSGSPG